MAEYLIQDTTLTEIADAIRSNTGESGPVAVADMAGIIGALAANNHPCNWGFFTGNGDAVTVEHGLGILPDVVMVWLKGSIPIDDTTYSIDFAVSLSNNARMSLLQEGIITTYSVTERKISSSVSDKRIARMSVNIEETLGAPIHSVNETTFTAGSSLTVNYITATDVVYFWLAIGGLT